jgi:hypothetical protein
MPVSLVRFKSFSVTVSHVLMTLIFVGYFVVRFWNVAGVEEANLCPDSAGYRGLSDLSLFSVSFWCGVRPFTVPMLYKALGNDLDLIIAFQWLLSVVSWTVLAFSVSRNVANSNAKLVAIAIILLFSLSEEILLWDGVILSESISISFMVLLIAAWFWVHQEWTSSRAFSLCCVAACWVFARDTNAWVLLVVSGILGFAGALKRSLRRYLALSGIFLALFIASDWSANVGKRWVFAFYNSIAQRVLPEEECKRFFEDAGMPVSPALLKMAGKWASSDEFAFYRDPALEEFRQWASAKGNATYMRFLLSRPATTIQAPFRSAEWLFSPVLVSYAPSGFRPVLSGIWAEILYFRNWTLFWLWAAGPIVAVAACLALRHRLCSWAVPISLVLLAYPHAVLVWNGDPMESGRHSIQACIQMRLGLWILILFGIDFLLTELAQRKSRDPQSCARGVLSAGGESQPGEKAPSARAKWHWRTGIVGLFGIGSCNSFK